MLEIIKAMPGKIRDAIHRPKQISLSEFLERCREQNIGTKMLDRAS